MPIRRRITQHGRPPVNVTGVGRKIMEAMQEYPDYVAAEVGSRAGYSVTYQHEHKRIVFRTYQSPLEFTLKHKGLVECVERPWFRLTDLGRRLRL